MTSENIQTKLLHILIFRKYSFYKFYNHGNNIAELFHALPNFPFTTSESKRNY